LRLYYLFKFKITETSAVYDRSTLWALGNYSFLYAPVINESGWTEQVIWAVWWERYNEGNNYRSASI